MRECRDVDPEGPSRGVPLASNIWKPEVGMETVGNLIALLGTSDRPAASAALCLLGGVPSDQRLQWRDVSTAVLRDVYSRATRRDNPAVLGSESTLHDFESTADEALRGTVVIVGSRIISVWIDADSRLVACTLGTDHSESEER
jgi:hypothetical protein